jgi:hypothetical protein
MTGLPSLIAEFASIGFVLTMVGGEIVYASGAFEGLDAAQSLEETSSLDGS